MLYYLFWCMCCSLWVLLKGGLALIQILLENERIEHILHGCECLLSWKSIGTYFLLKKKKILKLLLKQWKFTSSSCIGTKCSFCGQAEGLDLQLEDNLMGDGYSSLEIWHHCPSPPRRKPCPWKPIPDNVCSVELKVRSLLVARAPLFVLSRAWHTSTASFVIQKVPTPAAS